MTGATLKLAIAQINPIVGDIAGNADKILRCYDKAEADGAALLICPELALTGYPPEDLILMPTFRKRAMQAARALARKTAKGPGLLIGSLWEEGGHTYNAALLMHKKKMQFVQKKTQLPNYGIFDEKRLFEPGKGPTVTLWRGIRLGILVCEDVWNEKCAKLLKKQGAELIVVINASPYEAGKLAKRREMAAKSVNATGLPLVYVNMVGGQDDIVFDGGSFALSSDGKPALQMMEFSEQLAVVAVQKKNKKWHFVSPTPPNPMEREETLWRAMMLGLDDYVRKNKFNGVMLGLSGGIDSALTAALAVDALGPEKVRGVLLPSPYTSKESVEDAMETAELLGIKTMNIPITPGMKMFEETLAPVFTDKNWMENVSVGGNVQARLRGMILMALSNRYGWLLLSTGNKSEIAVGYTTLYGDSCGGYNVIKDLYKTQVYELAGWRNHKGIVIPQRSIDKAPSAELAPGQKDQDQLPPYGILDEILTLHIEERMTAEQIAGEDYKREVVDKILKLVRLSEYKRRQSAPGVKLSTMLFGRDRRYPLTNKF